MPRATLVAAIALASLAGCSQNAMLELELDLPAQSGPQAPARYANVRIVSGEVPWDQDWQVDAPLPSPKLDPSQPSVERVSVEGNADNEAVPVRVKVRFCVDPNCTAIGDDQAPEVRLQIDRAFYVGQRTSYAWSIACVPNVPGQNDGAPACSVSQRSIVDVSKCQVQGCRTGVTSSYCVGDKHFCEP